MKFESFETQRKISKKERISLLYQQIRDKFSSLERVVKKSGDIIKILSIVAFLSSQGEVMAHEGESFKKDVSLDTIEHMVEGDLETIHAQLESLKKPLPEDKKPSILLHEKEEDGEMKRETEGAVSFEDNHVGDLAIAHSTRKIDRENDNKVESLFTNDIEISTDYKESEIEGVGGRIQSSGSGETRDIALLNAIENLSHLISIDVFSAQVAESKENSSDKNDLFLSVVGVDALNYLEDVEIVSESDEGDGEYKYTVTIGAQPGELRSDSD